MKTYISKKQPGDEDNRTLKQKLACEYNFMLFRTKGVVINCPYNRILPPQLENAISHFNFERDVLIKRLEKESNRNLFMKLNEKKNG